MSDAQTVSFTQMKDGTKEDYEELAAITDPGTTASNTKPAGATA